MIREHEVPRVLPVVRDLLLGVIDERERAPRPGEVEAVHPAIVVRGLAAAVGVADVLRERSARRGLTRDRRSVRESYYYARLC